MAACAACLFDTGWNPDWMDRRFAEEGIDRLLQEGKIEALIVSHEHFDHFWGIGSTLKHCPDIPIYLPEGFHPAGLAFIQQQGHTGSVITVPSEQPLVLLPGLALASFPMSTLLQVHGENVLYANLQNQGLTMITGCGHGGVLNLLDYARRTFAGGEHIHAIYGGLHLSPLEDWDNQRDEIVKALAAMASPGSVATIAPGVRPSRRCWPAACRYSGERPETVHRPICSWATVTCWIWDRNVHRPPKLAVWNLGVAARTACSRCCSAA
jgi:metal-dependent hydrolase (beta-lactamase superfamily II)